MLSATILNFEGEWADLYGDIIQRVMPGYNDLHEMILSQLIAEGASAPQVLVVGAGGGKELVTYGRRLPQAVYTGVDPSSQMLEHASKRLRQEEVPAQIELRAGYVSDLPEGEVFDAATSCLVMHFLPDDGSKLRFLQDIASRLKPGAKLFLSDIYGDTSSEAFEHTLRVWKVYMMQHQVEEAMADQLIQGMRTEEYPITEARTFELLELAGFEGAWRFYTGLHYAGWSATKKA